MRYNQIYYLASIPGSSVAFGKKKQTFYQVLGINSVALKLVFISQKTHFQNALSRTKMRSFVHCRYEHRAPHNKSM